MRNQALSGMKEIQEFCKEIRLQWSERRILEMHEEDGFPMRKLGGSWESDRNAIIEWRKARLVGSELQTSYVKERNKFIPLAEKYANSKHGDSHPPGIPEEDRNAWSAAWSYTFHSRMSELWSGETRHKTIAAHYADIERERIYKAKLKELQDVPPKRDLHNFPVSGSDEQQEVIISVLGRDAHKLDQASLNTLRSQTLEAIKLVKPKPKRGRPPKAKVPPPPKPRGRPPKAKK